MRKTVVSIGGKACVPFGDAFLIRKVTEPFPQDSRPRLAPAYKLEPLIAHVIGPHDTRPPYVVICGKPVEKPLPLTRSRRKWSGPLPASSGAPCAITPLRPSARSSTTRDPVQSGSMPIITAQGGIAALRSAIRSAHRGDDCGSAG